MPAGSWADPFLRFAQRRR